MSQLRVRTAIVGAGLAGLSAAYHLGGDYAIFDKEPAAGGLARSQRLTDGYWFDYGIHVLHTKNEHVLDLVQRQLGVNLLSVHRKAWFFSHGAMTRYPIQANTYGLPVQIVKECLIGFIKATYEVSGPLPTDYAEWLYQTFGAGIADHFLIPYAIKFWTLHPRELDIDWLDVRVPRPTLDEVIEGALADQKKGFGPNATFQYPATSGVGALPAAFAGSIRDIHLNERVVKLDLPGKRACFASGNVVHYDKLVYTLPLPDLVGMVDEMPSAVLAAIARLRCNSIFCINLGIDRAMVSDKHWIYFPESEYPFFRISFPSNYTPTMAPPGTSSISAEVAYSRWQPLDKEGAIKGTIDSLRRSGILMADDRVRVLGVMDIPFGYPIYDHARQASVATIHAFLRQFDVLPAGRYGEWAYFWIDDAILSGQRAAAEAISNSRGDMNGARSSSDGRGGRECR